MRGRTHAGCLPRQDTRPPDLRDRPGERPGVAALVLGVGDEVELQRAAAEALDLLPGRAADIETGDDRAEALCGLRLRNSEDRILSLPALLALINGRVPLVLEVKGTWTREGKYEENIALLLASYPGPVAVMSFDPYCIASFKEIEPTLPRGLISERFSDAHYWSELSFKQRFAMRNLLTSAIARPHFVAYDIRALPALAPLVAQHLFGLPLLTWTVRTKEERDRALRYADAMIFEGITP